MLFRVLGPLDVLDVAAPVRLGGSEQRRLLAALLAHVGQPVPVSALVDLIWGEVPPPAAERLLSGQVSKLRRLLRDAAGSAVLRVVGAGYALEVARDDLDATRFEDLVDRGRALQAGGEHRPALRLLQEALGLWRGRAFEGVELDPSGQAIAERLGQERLTAWEARADAELALGWHDEVVEELTPLVEAHPDRERLAEQLVLASYRSGGRAVASAMWELVRERMVAASGTGPGVRLRTLRQQVRRDDPALRAPVPARRGGAGLPAPATSFVGREGELGLLLGLLRRGRLVTLTGPGGVGKTRLAVHLARLLRSSTDGRVEAVDVSGCSGAGDVLSSLVATLGVKEGIDEDPVSAIATTLGDAQSVLVLDGCEHIVTACAGVVRRLLDASTRLSVVVTSRVSLELPDERVYVVRPLELPDSDAATTGVRTAAAVRLFWDRAGLARPGLEPDDESRRAVEEICRRVDGLPLAVELAASLVRTMSPEEIVAHQRRRRSLPDAGLPAPVARRATPADLVEWSSTLLAPEAGRLLLGLSVFAGGFSAEAVDAVSVDAGSVDAGSGAAGSGAAGSGVVGWSAGPLAQLVRASLVNVEHHEGVPRYRLLETVRAFAADRLEAAGETGAWRDRHAAYFLELAETAASRLKGAAQSAWLQELRREEDNLRAALAHLAARPDGAERECRLAVALWRPCYLTGQYTQGRTWLRHALRHTGVDPALRAAVLSGCGALALYQCDYRPARRYCERAARLYAEVGDAVGRAEALTLLGSIAREQADYTRALALHAEAAEAFRAAGHTWGVAHSLELAALSRWLGGDLDHAARAAGDALRLAGQVGDEERAAWARVDLGAVALYRGDLATAGRQLDTALEAFDRLGFAEGRGWCHNLLGVRSTMLGEPATALVSLGLSLRTHRGVGDRWRICSVLEAVVGAACYLGLAARAAPLVGMVDRLREELGTPVPPVEAPARTDALARLSTALGDARLARARRRGETWTLDRACNEALALSVRSRVGSTP